jgi:photosystem II stability/assembly factor-like uncharacterized protein
MPTILRSVIATVTLGVFIGAQPLTPAVNPAFKALQWRGIGPALGGRVSDITVAATTGQDRDRVIYAAFATAGIWKSENGGASWVPIFDNEPTDAIFSVAVAASNPQIIWAATGDLFAHHNASYPIPGRGVFRSLDGGKTWSNMGFGDSEFLGRLIIDPTNPDVVYVGVLGRFGRPSEERGLYKTIDGGKSWQHIHFVNVCTGTVDLAMDPNDPQVLYAADIQLPSDARARALAHGRLASTLRIRGPGSGIYRTLDGGAHWTHLTSGLPSGSLGRIGLAVSPSQPSTIYAQIAAPETPRVSGLYRSDDSGLTWSLERGTRQTIPYWGRVFVDPNDAQRVYSTAQNFEVSDNGGKTAKEMQQIAPTDGHAMWIDPTNSDHIIFGNDRGLWYTWDRGKTVWHPQNIPTSMVVGVAYDRAKPFYHILASFQDHDAYIAPSSTINEVGILLSDWANADMNEDIQLVSNPGDPDFIYISDIIGSDNGYRRYSVSGDYGTGINPVSPLVPSYCCPNSSLELSPVDPRMVYIGIQRLYRSPDRGRTWSQMSARFRDRISAVAESPRQRGYLFVGTASGAIEYSPDSGQHWITGIPASGVPPDTAVTRIVASRYATNLAYATLAAVPTGDFHPYVVRTVDGGKHWNLIASNLPTDARTWTIVEGLHRQGVLFLATNDGVFFTSDDGSDWESLRGNMPPVAVTDIALQPDVDDLIAGSLGRGIYVLDDVRPLETLGVVEDRGVATLFPIRPAFRLPTKSSFFLDTQPPFAGPNAPNGVIINYYMPLTLLGHGTLLITDRSGNALQTFPIGKGGLQRVVWDMSAGALGAQFRETYPDGSSDVFAFKPLVPPGDYYAELWLGGQSRRTNRVSFTVLADPKTSRSPAYNNIVWRQELSMAKLLRGPLHVAISTAQRLEQELKHAEIVNPLDTSVKSQLADAATILSRMDSIRLELSLTASTLNEPNSEPLTPIETKEVQVQLIQFHEQVWKLDALRKESQHATLASSRSLRKRPK